mmetsp:Transcript_58124/g.189333  ORF Transcript_58124/g.189333 Transcript_58124/m.189333 type:complete len:89 (+) Transcript_58124:423-689(+)
MSESPPLLCFLLLDPTELETFPVRSISSFSSGVNSVLLFLAPPKLFFRLFLGRSLPLEDEEELDESDSLPPSADFSGLLSPPSAAGGF